jgi:hypothetical protein
MVNSAKTLNIGASGRFRPVNKTLNRSFMKKNEDFYTIANC